MNRAAASLRLAILTALALSVRAVGGPYAGGADGIAGTSTIFKAWATRVVGTHRPEAGSGGYARDDDGLSCAVEEAALGRPASFDPTEAPIAHVYSLGNGGSIVLEFDIPIHDGPGPDFAVFENGFFDYTDWTETSRQGSTQDFVFAELAFVEVASDTSHWARFPTVALNTQALHNLNNTEEDWFASQDATFLDGFAGKHVLTHGTPFDLEALRAHPAVVEGRVDLGAIRYVRLVDVVGDGSTFDSAGRPVYDPYYHFQNGYPHPAIVDSRDGFDLRAVGVLNTLDLTLHRSDGRFVAAFDAVSNGVYTVEWTDDPSAGDWRSAGSSLPGDNAPQEVAIDPPPSRAAVFRLCRQSGGP